MMLISCQFDAFKKVKLSEEYYFLVLLHLFTKLAILINT